MRAEKLATIGRALAQEASEHRNQGAFQAARAGEIASVDGCDMVFIGPNDLAGNLGFLERMGEPPVLASIEDAKAKTRAAGKYLVIVPHASKDATKLAGEGFDFVACGNDVIFLREAARADIAKHAAAYDIQPR
jgi:4-hydroxy-2-oxoheptanedioate aldolase